MKDRHLAQEADPAPPTAKLGRPKDHAKHAAIIVAAKQMFARLPYELVTMEAVAAQAGVSKMTVYSHFHDKETLFETIVSVTANQMIGALSGPETAGNTRERLTEVGTAFLQVVLGSEVCSMAHTLPGTLRDNKSLALRFYAAGPGRVRGALAAIINAAAARGELMVDDASLAADDLVSLWEGSMPAKIAYGLAGLLSPEEVQRRAVRGTDVFLRAYRRLADAPISCAAPALDSRSTSA